MWAFDGCCQFLLWHSHAESHLEKHQIPYIKLSIYFEIINWGRCNWRVESALSRTVAWLDIHRVRHPRRGDCLKPERALVVWSLGSWLCTIPCPKISSSSCSSASCLEYPIFVASKVGHLRPGRLCGQGWWSCTLTLTYCDCMPILKTYTGAALTIASIMSTFVAGGATNLSFDSVLHERLNNLMQPEKRERGLPKTQIQ